MPNSRALAACFGPIISNSLAQLPEVEQELKLTDAQKTKASELWEDLKQERGAIFQDAAGDLNTSGKKRPRSTTKLPRSSPTSWTTGEKKRLAEIYVQANGPTALFDDG